MAWTVSDMPSQRGRVVVVTGGNRGLGLATVHALASRGALVVMASRDERRSDEARRSVLAAVPGADLEVRALDLASLASVRSFAQGVLAEHEAIDLLINNAGVMGVPEQTTVDGFEMQWGVNHLGHFVLTGLLLPGLLRSPAARVVSVTSFGRLIGGPADPPARRAGGRYDPWRAYGRSKLANVRFAVELQRRLQAAGSRVASLVASPGLSHTDLQARSVRETGGGRSQRFWFLVARTVGMPPELAARAQLRAATDPAARGGEYYTPRWGTFGPPVRRPLLRRTRRPDATRELWEVSERETGAVFDVAGLVAAAARDRRD